MKKQIIDILVKITEQLKLFSRLRRQTHIVTDMVADMGLKELLDASCSVVGPPEVPDGAVDDRIGQEKLVAALLSLQVHDDHLALADLVAPVAEGVQLWLVALGVHIASVV